MISKRFKFLNYVEKNFLVEIPVHSKIQHILFTEYIMRFLNNFLIIAMSTEFKILILEGSFPLQLI